MVETVTDKPSLEGRIARCGYMAGTPGHAEGVPSNWGLAFFEYQGEDSYSSLLCKCGYAKVAHEYNEKRVSPEPIECKVGGYTPRGDVGHDSYYCGCRGWD